MIQSKKKQKLFVSEAISKMLEMAGYNKTYDDIIKENNPTWFSDYTMTTEQCNQWEEWFIKTSRKKLKCSKKRSEKEFMWFNLNYGLKIDDNKKQ